MGLILGDEPEPNVSGTNAGVTQAILLLVALGGYFILIFIDSVKANRRERAALRNLAHGSVLIDHCNNSVSQVLAPSSPRVQPSAPNKEEQKNLLQSFNLTTSNVHIEEDNLCAFIPMKKTKQINSAFQSGTSTGISSLGRDSFESSSSSQGSKKRLKDLQKLSERIPQERCQSKSQVTIRKTDTLKGGVCSQGPLPSAGSQQDSDSGLPTLLAIMNRDGLKHPLDDRQLFIPRRGARRQVSGRLVPASGGLLLKPRVSAVLEVDELKLADASPPSPRFNPSYHHDTLTMERQSVISRSSVLLSSSFLDNQTLPPRSGDYLPSPFSPRRSLPRGGEDEKSNSAISASSIVIAVRDPCTRPIILPGAVGRPLWSLHPDDEGGIDFLV